MSRTDWLLILQGAGITVQMLNAGLSALTHNAALALILGAIFGGFQFVVQRLGNNSVPENSPAQVAPEAPAKPSDTAKP